MAKYVGVDWASKGWLGIVLRDDDSWETDHFPTIWSLWKRHSDATRICIPLPIGLPADSKRACDVAAREKLDQQGRSVLYAPIRDAIYRQNLTDAKQFNEAAGYSIQNQTWGIVPRIREVDEFLDMNPGARDRLFETHPALCFYALNGHTAVPSMDTERGIDRRKTLVADEYPEAATIYVKACELYLTPKYSSFLSDKGHILDALAAAVTARRPTSELSRLPEGDDPPQDERGLTMQMVYPTDTDQTRLTGINETQTRSR
jgi:predicted RNase H-like nuclease